MANPSSSLIPELPFPISKGVTLVDFYASWCIACRNLEPALKKLEQAYNGQATIDRIDIDENRKIAIALGIQSIPTIIIFKDGRERRRLLGLQTLSSLSSAIDLILNS